MRRNTVNKFRRFARRRHQLSIILTSAPEPDTTNSTIPADLEIDFFVAQFLAEHSETLQKLADE